MREQIVREEEKLKGLPEKREKATRWVRELRALFPARKALPPFERS